MQLCLVTSDAHLDDLLSRSCTTVVYFTAAWCGPCAMMGPVFSRLAAQHTEIQFVKVDVDDIEDTRDVAAMPTFRVYKNGSITGECVGADSAVLEKLLQDA